MANLTRQKKSVNKILASSIFSRILYKINFSDKKANQSVLGIDILKADIQKDLLSITALRIEESYLKLLRENDPYEAMRKTGSTLFGMF